jgi:hypothetical protein
MVRPISLAEWGRSRGGVSGNGRESKAPPSRPQLSRIASDAFLIRRISAGFTSKGVSKGFRFFMTCLSTIFHQFEHSVRIIYSE